MDEGKLMWWQHDPFTVGAFVAYLVAQRNLDAPGICELFMISPEQYQDVFEAWHISRLAGRVA